MGKRIVIALGGNALGKNLPEQMQAVKETSKAITDLIEAGHQVVIAHGNGPQVGMIQNAFAAYRKQEPSADIMPLSMCVAMSQGYIGYDLQNALKEELLNRGLQQGVATVLTQVVVDENDPAFRHPTKPIGAFMAKAEAEKMAREKGWSVVEDAGRGWRQVVASPQPMAVVELTTIKTMPRPAALSSPAEAAVFRSLLQTATTSRAPPLSLTRTSPRSCWQSTSMPICSSSLQPLKRWQSTSTSLTRNGWIP